VISWHDDGLADAGIPIAEVFEEAWELGEAIRLGPDGDVATDHDGVDGLVPFAESVCKRIQSPA